PVTPSQSQLAQPRRDPGHELAELRISDSGALAGERRRVLPTLGRRQQVVQLSPHVGRPSGGHQGTQVSSLYRLSTCSAPRLGLRNIFGRKSRRSKDIGGRRPITRSSAKLPSAACRINRCRASGRTICWNSSGLLTYRIETRKTNRRRRLRRSLRYMT